MGFFFPPMVTSHEMHVRRSGPLLMHGLDLTGLARCDRLTQPRLSPSHNELMKSRLANISVAITVFTYISHKPFLGGT